MRLEDMKNDIPETPDFIHKMIQREVAKQIENTKVVNLRRRKKWTAPKVAAVAAVCALTVSSVAYAGVNLYQWILEKQGSYGVTVQLDGDGAAKENALPVEIPEVDLSAGYIPEGMSWTDEYHLKYPENEQAGGFSFAFVLLDKNDLGQVAQDRNVIDSEERTFGKYQGVYLKYNSIAESGTFNQRIYLVCPDLYRVLMIYVGDDVSKEDAIKVAENLVISETTTMVKTAGLPTWSDEIVQKTEEDSDEMITSIDEEKLPVYQVGDTFNLEVTGEDTNGEYLTETISAKVDSIQIADDLALLDPDKIPEKWAEAVGSDGKLIANTLNYVKNGDGIDSLDEVVMSEDVKQKLVYVTVTYTNDSDEEIDHMLYLGSLLTMTRENGKAQIYVSSEQSGDTYDHITWDGVAYTGEMVYYNVSENYGNGGNYISSIKPGESIQLNMAWIVNETDLPGLYLNLTGDGVTYEFSDYILKNGLVDIRES